MDSIFNYDNLYQLNELFGNFLKTKEVEPTLIRIKSERVAGMAALKKIVVEVYHSNVCIIQLVEKGVDESLIYKKLYQQLFNYYMICKIWN